MHFGFGTVATEQNSATIKKQLRLLYDMSWFVSKTAGNPCMQKPN